MKPTDSEERAAREGIAAALYVVDLIDAVAGAATADLALPIARRFVDSLDEHEVRRLAAVLAVDVVWRIPLPAIESRTAGEIADRQLELRRWCWRRRRAAVSARQALRVRRKVAERKSRPTGGRKPPGGVA